jgi:hypothetical protein
LTRPGPHSQVDVDCRAGGRPSSAPQLREAPVFSERTSVGLDVHARSIVACGLDTVSGQSAQRRLVPSAPAVLDWLRELPAPVAVAYEAGPTGFGLARQLTAAGVRCVVAALSKLHRPGGDRVKTDLLTELRRGSGCSARQVLIGMSTFSGRDGRRGRGAGSVPVGGCSAWVVGGHRGSVRAVSAR